MFVQRFYTSEVNVLVGLNIIVEILTVSVNSQDPLDPGWCGLLHDILLFVNFVIREKKVTKTPCTQKQSETGVQCAIYC